jgi:hypothetical protein
MIAQQRAASKVMYVLYHGEYKGQESVRVGGSLTPFFAPLDCCAAATFCGYCPGLVAACCAAATTRDYQLQLPRWDVPYPRSPTPAAKGGLLAALRYQVETVLCVGVMAACIMRLVPLLRVLEKFWRRLQRRYPANGVMAMKHVSLWMDISIMCWEYSVGSCCCVCDGNCVVPHPTLVRFFFWFLGMLSLSIHQPPQILSVLVGSRVLRTDATLLRHTCTPSPANTRRRPETLVSCDNALRRFF